MMRHWLQLAMLLVVTSAGSTHVLAQTRDRQICGQASGQQAIEACTRAIRANPRNADVFANRGYAWLNGGENEQAISDFNKALELNPRDAVALNNRGTAWANKGDFDRAIDDLNMALQINPTFINAYFARGNIWGKKQEFEKAISDFDKVLQINPKHEGALDSKETALREWRVNRSRKGSAGDPRVDLDNALQLDKKPETSFYNSGVTWHNKGDLDRAIADYTRVLDLDSTNINALYSRGLAWQRKGDFAKAIADHTRVIELDPRDADALNQRGVALRSKGDYEQSIADLTQALDINPKDSDSLRSRGLTWEVMGDFSKALEDATRAVRLTPDFHDAWSDIDRYKAKLEKKRQVPVQTLSRQILPNTSSATLMATARVALLIGNSRYRHAARLENPSNDVRLLERTLKQIGFTSVTVKTDLTTDELRKALQEFSVIAESADFAMIHYAGHAIQVGGINYVIPVDARIRTDRDIDFETIDVNKFMSALTGAKKLRVLVLDACRNNPFEENMRRTVASRSIGRGLGRMEAESGEMIVFAARAGQVALDGQGSLSPFAESFAQRLSQTPAIDVRRIFDFVRDDVLAKTSGKQQPFTYASLPSTEDIYFNQ